MEQAKNSGRPIIRPRYLYYIGEYEYWVIDKRGKIVGVYECMHEAEKKCEELENGNQVEQSL